MFEFNDRSETINSIIKSHLGVLASTCEYEDKIIKYQSEIVELQSEIIKYQSEIIKYKNEINKLKESNDDYLVRFKKSEDKIKRLRLDNVKLRKGYNYSSVTSNKPANTKVSVK